MPWSPLDHPERHLKNAPELAPPQDGERASVYKPWTPWAPARQAVMHKIMPKVPWDHRATVAEAFADLDRFNMLQPKQATPKGVAARRRQWDTISGGKAGKPSQMKIGVGVVVGLVAGAIIGLMVPPEQIGGIVALPAILAVLLAPVGGFAGHQFGQADGHGYGMIRVVVNERLSVIRPELVTGQSEAWVPRVLVEWRSHEWRYSLGRPYLWLQLVEERIQGQLNSTLDYLLLPNDLHRAKTSAIYAQRHWNKQISDTAQDFADIDEGSEEDDGRMKELAPWLLASGIVIAGVMLVVMVGG